MEGYWCRIYRVQVFAELGKDVVQSWPRGYESKLVYLFPSVQQKLRRSEDCISVADILHRSITICKLCIWHVHWTCDDACVRRLFSLTDFTLRILAHVGSIICDMCMIFRSYIACTRVILRLKATLRAIQMYTTASATYVSRWVLSMIIFWQLLSLRGLRDPGH